MLHRLYKAKTPVGFYHEISKWNRWIILSVHSLVTCQTLLFYLIPSIYLIKLILVDLSCIRDLGSLHELPSMGTPKVLLVAFFIPLSISVAFANESREEETSKLPVEESDLGLKLQCDQLRSKILSLGSSSLPSISPLSLFMLYLYNLIFFRLHDRFSC